MTELYQLPPRPAGVRTLTNPEADRIDRLYPGTPKSPDQCPTCGGRKTFQWWNYYAPGYATATKIVVEYECPCVDQWIMHRYLLHCGLDKLQQRYTVHDATGLTARTQELVRAYLDKADRYVDSGRSLVFFGDRGTGKSFVSALMAKQLAARGFSVYFTTFAGLLGRLRESWEDADARRWFQRRIRNVEFLVIDDIGMEHMQKSMVPGVGIERSVQSIAESSLNEILGDRVSGAKPSILTSNLTVEQIGQNYGGRIEDLILESAIKHRFTSEDFRREAAGKRSQEEADLDLTRPLVIA